MFRNIIGDLNFFLNRKLFGMTQLIKRLGMGLIIFGLAFLVFYLSLTIFLLALFFHLSGLTDYVVPAVWCGILSLGVGILLSVIAMFVTKRS